jgi:hypothetical protein
MADGSHRNTSKADGDARHVAPEDATKQGINSNVQMLRTCEHGQNLSNPCAYHGTVTSIALRRWRRGSDHAAGIPPAAAQHNHWTSIAVIKNAPAARTSCLFGGADAAVPIRCPQTERQRQGLSAPGSRPPWGTDNDTDMRNACSMRSATRLSLHLVCIVVCQTVLAVGRLILV